jgi:peptide/nickel transport system permease protein
VSTRAPADQSLGKLAWTRLLKDRNALVGMVLIGTAALVAVLGGIIRPDTSAWANRQVLGIRDQKPGFEVLFLKVPSGGSPEACNFLDRMFFGGCPALFEPLPVHSYSVVADSIVVEEFNGHNALVPGVLHRFAILDLLPEGVGIPADDASCEEALMQRERFALGTDSFGRDVLSRLMAGTIISLSVGLIAVLISLVIGIPLGAVAGYFRAEAPTFRLFGRRFRWPVDDAIMWLVNVVWSIPTLLLVIAITLALGKGFVQVFIAVGLTMWVEVARIVRGEVIRVREMEFVEAAKALGYSHGRIIFDHILPNVMGPVIVISAANFATAILMEAGLSFLGIGAQLPMVSWGGMIRSYYPYITTELWQLALLPGVCIMLLTLAFMLVGNGLRDALDTRSITAR